MLKSIDEINEEIKHRGPLDTVGTETWSLYYYGTLFEIRRMLTGPLDINNIKENKDRLRQKGIEDALWFMLGYERGRKL